MRAYTRWILAIDIIGMLVTTTLAVHFGGSIVMGLLIFWAINLPYNLDNYDRIEL